MSSRLLLLSTVVIFTVVAIEFIAAAVHKHIMHGFGWALHRSHHLRSRGPFEANDLYALAFAALSICLFVGGASYPLLWWIGFGMGIYGILYGLLHDVLIHRRVAIFRSLPRSAYLKRLVQAHRLHHAVRERKGAVSFGFLYAPSVHRLIRQLRRGRTRG